MSIIERVFKYEETELSVIKRQDDLWFRAKTISEILGYSNPLKAIRTHVDSEDKKGISELGSNSRVPKTDTPLRTNSEIPFTIMNPGYLLLSFDPSYSATTE